MSKRPLRIAGLFAGIGGFELGLSDAGCESVLLCEIDEDAQSVLEQRFDSIRIESDVARLDDLPSETDIVCAGFPCQNLSMAGDKSGINGAKSTIVEELMRLIKKRSVPWVVIENVYFMLHLKRGEGMHQILGHLEALGYKWAYRVVDSRCFGLAQRRRRVFIVASLDGDPRNVLLSDDALQLEWPKPSLGQPIGFYWTEGDSGHGLTGNAIPPLKAGSGIGIPSPPAVLLPNGRVVTPPIEAVERLQGFPKGWTSALDIEGKGRHRWRLVGNAVSVPVTKWLGNRLVNPRKYDDHDDEKLLQRDKWPTAAWNMGGGRRKANVSENPVKRKRGVLSAFAVESWPNLSKRALSGFVSRARKSSLRYPEGFLEALERRRDQM